MKKVLFITTPDVRPGFRLAGVDQFIAEAHELEDILIKAVHDPERALIVLDERLIAGIDDARFRKPVIPGDQLKLVVEVVRHRREIWVFDGKALVDNDIVAEARIMAMLKMNKE